MTQIASQEDVDKILKAFYLVYNTLGYGFLERVYQNVKCKSKSMYFIKIIKWVNIMPTW